MPSAYWIDPADPVIDLDVDEWFAVSPDGNFLCGTVDSYGQGLIRTIDSSEPDFLIPNTHGTFFGSQFNLCNDILVGLAGSGTPIVLNKAGSGDWDMTVLSPLPGYAYEVDALAWGYGVDYTGRRIIGEMMDTDTSVRYAVMWDDSTTPTALGSIEGFAGGSTAFRISADGTTIGGWVTEEGGSNPQAFLWTEADGMRLLTEILTDDYGIDFSSYILTNVTGISATGKHVVAFGYWDTGYSLEPRFFYLVLP